ncbi:MAG: hypothetical protein OXH39_18765 [Candidatus Poribacteria bacterium]|nr:hypothetical protein [Candidatus Poribacteria bacterium]
MDTLKEFEFKQRKYMPTFPKATGKPTIYIEGYPCEDDEPMAATGFHADQIRIFSDQISRYFAINPHIYIGIDSFIYYREGDITKFVAPDVYVVFGVDKFPQRRSFYTWSEGAVPAAIFEFLSDATANQDRHEKVQRYLRDMAAQEYFIHQPEMEKPSEFRGWQRNPSGNIVELSPDAQGGLFSEALNLYFRWEDQLDTHVRLLRPYLPDGTPITTSMEEEQLRIEEQQLRIEEQQLRIEAETRAAEETQRRREAEIEIERLRRQLANR